MPDTYFIDAYNVMYQSEMLRPIAVHDFEGAREALIDKVALHCMLTGSRAVVVFDGRSRHLPEQAAHHRHTENLEVVYAPNNLSADAVIERMVYRAPARREVVVVSNDRGLRDLSVGMGAMTMKADNFLETLRQSREDVRETIARTRVERPAHLESRLDSGSLERLQQWRERLNGDERR